MTADEAKQLKALFEKWEQARETATQTLNLHLSDPKPGVLKVEGVDFSTVQAMFDELDNAKEELHSYIAANTSTKGNVPDTFYALEVLGAPYWTKYFTTRDLAQKALQKDKDEIRYRMGVKVIEDTPDTFVFLLGWEERRSERRVKEYNFTA